MSLSEIIAKLAVEHPSLIFAVVLAYHIAVVVFLAAIWHELTVHNTREAKRDFMREFEREKRQ